LEPKGEFLAPETGDKSVGKTASEIFSVGVILYKIVTGKLPFSEGNFVIAEKEDGDKIPMLPSSFDSNIPKELDLIILKCLEKKPEERFSSVIEMLKELEKVYLKYNFASKHDLSFIFGATVVSGEKRTREKRAELKNIDIIKQLNKGSLADPLKKDKFYHVKRIIKKYLYR